MFWTFDDATRRALKDLLERIHLAAAADPSVGADEDAIRQDARAALVLLETAPPVDVLPCTSVGPGGKHCTGPLGHGGAHRSQRVTWSTGWENDP